LAGFLPAPSELPEREEAYRQRAAGHGDQLIDRFPSPLRHLAQELQVMEETRPDQLKGL